MREGSGERLATISYLPGVTQPLVSESGRGGAGDPREVPASGVDGVLSDRETSGVATGWFVESADDSGSTGMPEPAGEPQPTAELTPRRSEASDPVVEPSGPGEPESQAELAARAATISMQALTRKGMSSREMIQRLRSREIDEETVFAEVARLERVALLDDRELAATLVRTLQDRKGLGRAGITAELRRRLVDPAAVEEALDALGGDDELARARELAVKRAPQLRSLDSVTARRRLSAFLMRKGYSGPVVNSAVTAALEPFSGGGGGPRFR